MIICSSFVKLFVVPMHRKWTRTARRAMTGLTVGEFPPAGFFRTQPLRAGGLQSVPLECAEWLFLIQLVSAARASLSKLRARSWGWAWQRSW